MNIRFRNLRVERFKSVQALADVCGIVRPTLSAIENGRRPVSFHNIDVLCKIFEVSTDYILGKSDTGIKVTYKTPTSQGSKYISEEQFKKAEQHIYILGNTRYISREGMDLLAEEDEHNNSELLVLLMTSILNDSTSIEIVKLLPYVKEDKKLMLLSLIKSWDIK